MIQVKWLEPPPFLWPVEPFNLLCSVSVRNSCSFKPISQRSIQPLSVGKSLRDIVDVFRFPNSLRPVLIVVNFSGICFCLMPIIANASSVFGKIAVLSRPGSAFATNRACVFQVSKVLLSEAAPVEYALVAPLS